MRDGALDKGWTPMEPLIRDGALDERGSPG